MFALNSKHLQIYFSLLKDGCNSPTAATRAATEATNRPLRTAKCLHHGATSQRQALGGELYISRSSPRLVDVTSPPLLGFARNNHRSQTAEDNNRRGG